MVIVLLISYWHREDTGYVMLCYFGMGLLYYVLHCTDISNRQKVFRFIGILWITILLLLISKQIDYVVKEEINPEGFTEFNEARVNYMDYPHITYYENPQVFEEYGWDENLASLVSDWCFLDERVTTEAFTGIYEADVDYQYSFFTPFVSLLKESEYTVLLTCFFVGVAILGEVYISVSGLFLSTINFFFAANFGGSLVLLLFLVYRGRLPLRAYMIVILPMVLISCLLMLKARIYGEKCIKSELVWNLSVIVLTALAIPSFLQNYDTETIQNKYAIIEECNTVDEYLRENRNNIYITDVEAYKNINPFNQTSYNHFWWGDSTFYSDYFYRQLEMNGLSELNMENFKRDNVYFVTTSTDGQYNDNVSRLLECLRAYGVVGVEKVDCIGGVRDVYQFRFGN